MIEICRDLKLLFGTEFINEFGVDIGAMKFKKWLELMLKIKIKIVTIIGVEIEGYWSWY